MDILDATSIVENGVHQLALNVLVKVFSDRYPERFIQFTKDCEKCYEKYPNNYSAVFDAVLVSYLIEVGLMDDSYNRIYSAVMRGLRDAQNENNLRLHAAGREFFRKQSTDRKLLQATAN